MAETENVDFAKLTRLLMDADTTAGVLERVVEAAHRVVPGAELVSITLRSPDGRFHTPIETAPIALELDQVQYDTGEGPCLDAARPEGPAYAHSADLAKNSPWPRFGPAAARHGYHAVLSTALVPDAKPPRLSGALNIYRTSDGDFGDDAWRMALLLATHGSLALARTEAVTRAELEAAQLRDAIATRDVIGQAKGILMERRGMSADEAFGFLRGASQSLNVRLAELAETLVTRRSELDPPR
ncbi:GAF and ANTAR domain-containing protein [Amycolatopsis sp. 195334CR]|uniref:GAF and ANTAR domain-containing protein n=1 Tax=Amycolatopsis sp. 195334CR TaxID=2814588 RepID=UPI001A8C74AF|nr:GAF and ANTAR domain-containing protein [Amycolatopsis sp. 195334CR]MBN6039495.1 GAF and ANTAR domain-containing protein [Amycolatopsis sp. 195334CR]